MRRIRREEAVWCDEDREGGDERDRDAIDEWGRRRRTETTNSILCLSLVHFYMPSPYLLWLVDLPWLVADTPRAVGCLGWISLKNFSLELF